MQSFPQLPNISFASLPSMDSVKAFPSKAGTFFTDAGTKISEFVSPYFADQGSILSKIADKKWHYVAFTLATCISLIAISYLIGSKPAAKPAEIKTVEEKTKTDPTEPAEIDAASAAAEATAAAEAAARSTVTATSLGKFGARFPELAANYDKAMALAKQTSSRVIAFKNKVETDPEWAPLRASASKGVLAGAALALGVHTLFNLSQTVSQLFIAAVGSFVVTGAFYAWDNSQAILAVRAKIHAAATI